MKKLILPALALLLASSTISGAMRSSKSDVTSNINIFSSIIKELQANYVDSIDMNSIVETGISAMLSRLDPYTEYFNVSEQKEFRDRNAGEYAGIGSYIMQRNGFVEISGPHEGSPAAAAGLRPGDRILAIDGEDMKGKTTEDVSGKLRGAIGSKTSVSVSRPWVTDSLLTVEVTREKIRIPAVTYYGVTDGNLGYIQLSQYSEKSADEVKDALTDLMENSRIEGLILDLRGNGGGYLESAVKILGYFLPKGTEVLRTRGKGLRDEKIYRTSAKPIAPDLPLVVLTDGTTASSSEITAGALQDLDRAVILGMRTYGKGLVQTTFGLPYDGMIKVTTAKYYIPSGRLIQSVDYSERGTDGRPKQIADSLTREFRTAGGRIVRDGGGITPDTLMEYPEVSRLLYNVVTDQWAYDFANKYRAEHPDVPSIDSIAITDEIYGEFKNFIDPARFNYDKVCETAISDLRKLAKIEGYMSDEVDAQITVLEGLMKHTLDKDLDTHRKAIAPYLEREIASRYYYDRGETRSSLRHDDMFKAACSLLKDRNAYNSILNPAKAGKK